MRTAALLRRVAAGVLLSLLLPACSRRPADQSSSPAISAPHRTAVILRRGNGPEPESLDVHAARSEAALTILRDLYEGLTAMGVDGRPILAAADRFDLSPDGTAYRFHLRPEARWSNGEPLVAEDFAAAWRRLVDPHTASQYADLLSPMKGFAAIRAGNAPPGTLAVHADGAQTLVVELTRPTAYFLAVLSHPATFPINRPALAAHGRAFSKPGNLVSNGAFVLRRWDFGSHLVAVRNAFYWDAAATRLDGVDYYSYADGAAELRAFRGGALDSTSTIPAAQIPWIEQHLGAALRVAPQLAVYYLGLNLRKPPFAGSRELRLALSLVIDRDRIVRSITAAGEAPAYTFVPPAVEGYSPPLPDYATWSMGERIARARQLLGAAHLPANLPPIEVSYNSGELHERVALAVTAMWKESLGIEATLRAEEFKILLQDIERGDVTVFRASWVADYNDPYGFLQALESGSGINLPRYANPQYDALLEHASMLSGAARPELLSQAEALMLADQPLIPLYFYVSKHLVSMHVHGWQNNAMNVVYSRHLDKEQAEDGG